MSVSQWFSLCAVVILAPHLSYQHARWVAGLSLLWAIFGAFIMEWMSK